MAIDLKRFLIRFVEEARDHLTRLEEGLAALASDPGDREVINSIFRSAHTIKGSSRMLKLMAINETAHHLEDILGALREGSLAYSSELGRLLQRGVDALAQLVEQVVEGKTDLDADQPLCNALAAVLGGHQPSATEVTAGNGDATVGEPADSLLAEKTGEGSGEPRLRSANSVRIQLGKLDELIKLMGEVVTSHARFQQRVRDLRAIEHELSLNDEQHNRLHRFGRQLQDDVLGQALLVEELHNKALQMRMLPLAMVFEPMARMARDLARNLDKEVECITSGMEIELDRQMIERISDPIVHLLRNCVDHGIEAPPQRQVAGKLRHGSLGLSASQDGGFVEIVVSDDGAGLSLAAIRDKAIRKGLIDSEQADNLSENELIEMIFLPGFSTNSIITDLSGRGVGMDVVKRCVVDELQGMISVQSKPGLGTRFTLRLPLSLAVMRVLLVEAGGRQFGFTAQYVDHLLEVPAERIICVAERRAVVIDNEFVPVVALTELLSLDANGQHHAGRHLLLVVRSANSRLALRIDGLVDESDMVIKPLPEHLRQLPFVAGMVMMGGDTLVSILQVRALFDAAQRMRGEEMARQGGEEATETQGMRVLVVDDSLNTREIERDVLEAHGYRITLAEDGLDGLQKARQGEFDAVLTDVEMPNMDGFTLTATLRQEDRYRHVPIIIITSREKEEDKRRGIEVGADAYIVKGDFDQSNLLDTLKTLLA